MADNPFGARAVLRSKTASLHRQAELYRLINRFGSLQMMVLGRSLGKPVLFRPSRPNPVQVNVEPLGSEIPPRAQIFKSGRVCAPVWSSFDPTHGLLYRSLTFSGSLDPLTAETPHVFELTIAANLIFTISPGYNL